jgi:short-subunit dehydrogenase
VKRCLKDSRGIITGASSGIGRALAIELARAGARLVLVARSENKLSELAAELIRDGREAAILVGDVTNQQTRAAAVELSGQTYGGLDFVVNNAGIGALGRFADATPERLRSVFKVNFFAAAEMIRTALPLLSHGNRPIVVNVGSILGHRGIPHASEYCASKFALRGLTESIRTEFVPLGIDVLLVSPGTTQTDFFQHALENKQVPWPEQKGVSPELVARRIRQAMERGRKEIIVNPRGKALVLLNRFLPGIVDRILRRYP